MSDGSGLTATGSRLKTAVVHDWLNGMRGGEKVLEAILPLLPSPTIFTLFHVPGSVSPEIERYTIRASWLNRLPGSRRGYRHLLPLFPSAVESFDLSGFDLVVSSSHCVAKGAIAPPGTPHLCYCHTPVRYAYEQFDLYFPPGRTRLRRWKAAAIARLRAWDVATASRPTRYLANSSAVAERIERYYGKTAAVCHPPVDVEFFRPADRPEPREPFLLAVGALVPYKRFEVAIDAARRLRRRLVLVGRGPEAARLSALSRDSDIEIRSGLGGDALRDLYRSCAAYVQPGEEDFGISAVEALACGAPVVALGRGGARDIVRDGENGVLCEDGSDALAAAVARAEALRFDYTFLRASALPFRGERFAAEFRGAIGELKK
jgi:glycosyltransferase involved in cell wall biosynthesis